MIETLALGPSDRVFVLAPHPDDESVATGGLLQHAIATGARVKVVFVSDGENNPWAQRASELRWRIRPSDRARFGARRRQEGARALATLGADPSSARFLGFPDQGATDLLLGASDVAMNALTDALGGFNPTVVAGPSLLDLHPDHSALAVMLEQALDLLSDTITPRRHIRYVVHNPHLLHHHEGSLVLPLADEQRTRKRAAIACHRTQLVLRGSWLLSFAGREERYYLDESHAGMAEHPLGRAVCSGGSLLVTLASRTRLRAFGRRTLCLVARSRSAADARLAVELPLRDGTVPVRDLRTGATVAEARYRGHRGRGELALPASLLPPDARTFAKLERRFGFFDEAGWKELAPPAPRS